MAILAPGVPEPLRAPVLVPEPLVAPTSIPGLQDHQRAPLTVLCRHLAVDPPLALTLPLDLARRAEPVQYLLEIVAAQAQQ